MTPWGNRNPDSSIPPGQWSVPGGRGHTERTPAVATRHRFQSFRTVESLVHSKFLSWCELGIIFTDLSCCHDQFYHVAEDLYFT